MRTCIGINVYFYNVYCTYKETQRPEDSKL